MLLCAGSGGMEWCGPTGGLWEPRRPCAVSQREVVTSLSQQHFYSSGNLVLGNLPWQPLLLPLPMSSSDFLCRWFEKDGCAWWLLLLRRMREKGCGKDTWCFVGFCGGK